MQDFNNTKIYIDEVNFYNGLVLKNVEAYINYNFLIVSGKTESKTNWINLASINRMEGVEISGE